MEYGYTPKNLRELRKQYDLTQAQVAQITETKTQPTVARWELELDNSSHVDMPYTKWQKLKNYLNIKD